MLSALQVGTALTHNDFVKAVMGFGSQLEFYKTDFQCDNCGDGDTPPYIVVDGKCLAPRCTATSHIQEFDQPASDKTCLPQSTQFADRVFLSSKKERDFVRYVLSVYRITWE